MSALRVVAGEATWPPVGRACHGRPDGVRSGGASLGHGRGRWGRMRGIATLSLVQVRRPAGQPATRPPGQPGSHMRCANSRGPIMIMNQSPRTRASVAVAILALLVLSAVMNAVNGHNHRFVVINVVFAAVLGICLLVIVSGTISRPGRTRRRAGHDRSEHASE